MKKTTVLLLLLALLCVAGFFLLCWKPWREAKHRWTFKGLPTEPDRAELMRALRGGDVELSFDERLHYWRELERTRHSDRAQTGGKSFEERYPHGALTDRVQRYLDMEDILRQKYEIIITDEMLEAELVRIERGSLDRQRLGRYKEILDRRLLREILAKPVVVERRIRQRFILDRSIQEELYLRAKALRRGLDARNFRERGGKLYARLVFWLGKGRAPEPGMLEAKALRRGLTPSNFRERAGKAYARLQFWLGENGPPRPEVFIPSDEMRSILTGRLKSPGDMTEIIEQEASFQILMLVTREDEVATVDAIRVRKAAFRPSLIPDNRMRVILAELLKEPGEMTGVIEQQTSFQILMLASREDEVATVDAITVPKVTFDEWFAKERALLKIQRDLHRAPVRR